MPPEGRDGATAVRVAALYDIHGNLPALEAVLDELRAHPVDLILVGGDVLPGPFPRASLEALYALSTPVRFIHGNGESAVLALREGRAVEGIPESALEVIRWVAGELSDEEAEDLASWPSTEWIDMPGLGRVCFCHATPRSDDEIFTKDTPDEAVASAISDADARLIVCGHTHMPFDRTVAGVRIVNAGSVGMPFGEPGAYWLLLTGDPTAPAVDLRRAVYDLDSAASRVRASPYPDAEGFAQGSVLEPPDAEEMLALFERVAIRG